MAKLQLRERMRIITVGIYVNNYNCYVTCVSKCVMYLFSNKTCLW